MVGDPNLHQRHRVSHPNLIDMGILHRIRVTEDIVTRHIADQWIFPL